MLARVVEVVRACPQYRFQDLWTMPATDFFLLFLAHSEQSHVLEGEQRSKHKPWTPPEVMTEAEVNAGWEDVEGM